MSTSNRTKLEGVGWCVEVGDGVFDGCKLGGTVGPDVGETERVGSWLGIWVGGGDGMWVGVRECEGSVVGSPVGCGIGSSVGGGVGSTDMEGEAVAVGESVG